METLLLLFFSCVGSALFKSYYVVWKLKFLSDKNFILACLNRTMQYGNCDDTEFPIFHYSFKSYYVVWKLDFKTVQFWKNTRFKSYYVVWKHAERDGILPERGSLNRTMQYGNSLLFLYHFQLLARLNRTMQYGNHENSRVCRNTIKQFKSYYVVWKPQYDLNMYANSLMFKSYYVVWKLHCVLRVDCVDNRV